MINVGIIGCGFVGGALKDWLEHNNPECKLFISDPYKGYNDDLSKIDIAFLQIHVPTEDDGTQDLTLMKELITNLPNVPVFVRTTILPGTSEMLSKETGHQVCYMPEFLTERTFIEDFRKQTMVFTGAQELLTKIFVGKKFTVMTPLEAELTKYMHNVFGAYKVTYFNACREYCEQMGADWRKVHLWELFWNTSMNLMFISVVLRSIFKEQCFLAAQVEREFAVRYCLPEQIIWLIEKEIILSGAAYF